MSSYSFLQGTGVAVITPFNADRTPDFVSLDNHINHLINSKIDYLVLMGTTGESATLMDFEKKALLLHVVDICKGRIPLVAGMGGNNTFQLQQQLKELNTSGISAILSITPYYNKPNQEGLFQHYCQLSKASPLPIILYNVPSRTGTNLLPSTVFKLAEECENIIGIKEASANMNQVSELIKGKPNNFWIISGDDATTLPFLTLGGDGVISVIANAVPLEFSQMVKHALKGSLKDAQTIHYKLIDLCNLLFIEGSPSGIKALLNMQGMIKNHLRLPLVPVSSETYQLIEQAWLQFEKVK